MTLRLYVSFFACLQFWIPAVISSGTVRKRDWRQMIDWVPYVSGSIQAGVGDGDASAAITTTTTTTATTAAAPSLPNTHHTLQVWYATLIELPRVGPGHPSSPPCPSFPPFYFSLSFIGFTCFLLLSIPSLSTRIVPFRFQAGGRRRRPNLG